MKDLDWRQLVDKELKRRDTTFPEWYFDILNAPEDVLDVTSLPEKLDILSPVDIEITHLDGVGVVEAVRNKRFTCVQVIEAFSKRALLAQKYVLLLPISRIIS
jgi:hypothetical protein